MPFNINEIRSHLVRGGARPTLFQVQITNPINGSQDLEVPFMVKASSLPQLSVSQIIVPYFGRQIYVPGDRNWQPWTATIINDENFKIRNAIEHWNTAMNSLEGNLATEGSPPSLYKSQATVIHYGKDGEELRIYQFNGIFPMEVAPIQLSWEQRDTIEEFEVTFSFDDFEVVGGTSPNTLRI